MKTLLVLAAALPFVAALDACTTGRVATGRATTFDDPVEARKLEPGRWTGTMSWCCVRPGSPRAKAIEHRLDAIYDVTVKGDTIAIMGRFTEPHTGEGLSFPLNDVKVIGDTLTFWVSADERSAVPLCAVGHRALS